MLRSITPQRIRLWSLVAVLVGAASSPVLANSIQVAPGLRTNTELRGYTRGTMGLHNIVGDRDQNQNRCMGYGSASSDHQIDVKRGINQLTLQVRSKLKDTTLVIRGPGKSIFCADDSSLGKDAGITLKNLPPGRYEVWVGSFDAGDKFAYTLSIQ